MGFTLNHVAALVRGIVLRAELPETRARCSLISARLFLAAVLEVELLESGRDVQSVLPFD